MADNRNMKAPVIHELVTNDVELREESFWVGVLLSTGIGILNACTWTIRGHVFASSQSGNLLYLGLDFAQGDFSQTVKYLFPPLMFALGIMIAEHYHDKPNYPQWRRIPFMIEIFLIIMATFMPLSWNALANPIFGLCCGLQAITFKRIRKMPVSTIVINGSYQNAIVHWVRFFHLKDREDEYEGVFYLMIVICYFGGIVIGGILSRYLRQYVSLITAAMLIGCCFIALKHPQKYQQQKAASAK